MRHKLARELVYKLVARDFVAVISVALGSISAPPPRSYFFYAEIFRNC